MSPHSVSSGLDVSADYSTYVGYLSGVLIRGTDMLFTGKLHYWRAKDLDPKALADAAIQEFRRVRPFAAERQGAQAACGGLRRLGSLRHEGMRLRQHAAEARKI